MRRLTVVQLLPALDAGGVEQSTLEIAEALVTSVRTVEGHLYRACQRVGATSRSDLAAIMRAGPA